MFHALRQRSSTFFRLLPLALMLCGTSPSLAASFPDAAIDQGPGPPQIIVLAGGCFWGMQAVFQHLKGVKEVTAGYAGGSAKTAHYNIVSTGTTGHAESVQVSYDPSQITLGKILKVYFSVAHDPTEVNRQGPDTGQQYRSEIFTTTTEQQNIAFNYIGQLSEAKVYASPIVTIVQPLRAFYAAEDYHQNYFRLHPDKPYIIIYDKPKIAALKKEFPDLYVEP